MDFYLPISIFFIYLLFSNIYRLSLLIGGLQKTTSLDYPGLLVCTVFTVGCNFRCPFCHNRFLVTMQNFKESGERQLPEEEFFAFLKKRQGLLDGVCVTGGEPTLHLDLPEFLKKIKDLGYRVKLDTNGTNPKMLAKLLERDLVNYVAMDLKTFLDGYLSVVLSSRTSASRDPGSSKYDQAIRSSISLILKSEVAFEFRTTIVPGLHDQKSLLKLAEDLKQVARETATQINQVPWYLQNFQPQNCLNPLFNNKAGFSEAELLGLIKAIKPHVPQIKLRSC